MDKTIKVAVRLGTTVLNHNFLFTTLTAVPVVKQLEVWIMYSLLFHSKFFEEYLLNGSFSPSNTKYVVHTSNLESLLTGPIKAQI